MNSLNLLYLVLTELTRLSVNPSFMKSEDDIGDSLNYLKKLDNSATGFIRDQFPILNNNTLSSKKVLQTRSD